MSVHNMRIFFNEIKSTNFIKFYSTTNTLF